MKILNFGSLNLDYVYRVTHMVLPGETLATGAMQVFCGGKGLNQSIALARAGAQVYHAGMIGEDGAILLETLSESGINVDFVRTCEDKSGHTIIQVDDEGQNSILLYGGANRRLSKEFINQVLESFGEGDILLLQNEINHLSYIIEKAFAKSMKIVLNPSPFDENLSDCDFSKISLLLLNEVEAYQITREQQPDMILTVLKEKYPDAEVVLTLGSEGCIYQGKGKTIKQNAFPAAAIDTTGAGDTFTGYFVASKSEKKAIEECLSIASKAAAIAVTRQGASPSIPFLREVLEAEEKCVLR